MKKHYVHAVRLAKDVNVIEETINKMVAKGWEYFESKKSNDETDLYFRKEEPLVFNSKYEKEGVFLI